MKIDNLNVTVTEGLVSPVYSFGYREDSFSNEPQYTEISVRFTAEELDKFRPNDTVSGFLEYLRNDELNLIKTLKRRKRNFPNEKQKVDGMIQAIKNRYGYVFIKTI